ncbi:AGC family protein kinase [Histomonas meleagridis]|uniref:AGC family protein kinase n=1 Tax=Histomonas meleagridis TaxID=135588 RepID=UPI003559468C|nr:AGC family protein kinase [Histomonas meleagridis]KAH0805795.1 AGC family protein kinase [Histomonas meleagridis]
MEDYYLINQIGEGSFGRVYKARRKHTGRIVAIKMINKLGQTPDDIQSFRREIDLLQKVNHPNVMRMLHVFETDTDFCVVSELARGDLFQVIDDNQTLPESVLKNIAAQLVSALAHLHSKHIIHRDMKPQNILIANKSSLKLCDFGFARALSQTTLVLTSIKGTPLYMAPELVQEQQYDEKVDIWALGVILYELYYGKPPFYTNSIYKLIQMIVSSPIQYPDEISPQFKKFLNRMLQKDPSKRVSCQELISDPFIANVQLDQFDDHVMQFKTKQFEKAIHDSLLGSRKLKFHPPKSKIPDYQMIFMNPSEHSNDELSQALKYLIEKDISSDSPLATTFALHFESFISNNSILEQTLILATNLLKKESEKFSPYFSSSISLFGTNNMIPLSITFFVQLLAIPYSKNVINSIDTQIGDLKIDEKKSKKLRDSLLSFLFSSDEEIIEKTFVLMSFFSQNSEIMLKSFSGSFSPQIIPILTSAIYTKTSILIRCSAFSILSKIIEANNDAIHYIQPFSKFLETFDQIVSSNIKTIEEFCLFSAALSFIAVSIYPLSQMEEFSNRYSVRESLSTLPTFLQMVFKGKHGIYERLQNFLLIGSMEPKTESEILCYGTVLSSPFCHIPIQEEFLEPCSKYIIKLIPFHQPSLLSSIFALQPEKSIKYLTSFISFFSKPSCANIISEYVLNILSEKSNQYIVEPLCENGIILSISSLICDMGPDVPPNVVIVLVQIILSFKQPTRLLIEEATEMLNSIFSVDLAVESGMIIASHLARLSKDFLPALNECGALNLAERAIQSDVHQIRSRTIDFIGNICKYEALPDQYIKTIVPFLIKNLGGNEANCRKLAAFALGNVLFWSPEVSDLIMENIDDVKSILTSDDAKAVENAAGLLANIVRKSDKYVSKLILNGCLELLVSSLENFPELEGKTILPIAVFCQYKDACEYLKRINAKKIFAKFTKSKNERIQRYACKLEKLV